MNLLLFSMLLTGANGYRRHCTGTMDTLADDGELWGLSCPHWKSTPRKGAESTRWRGYCEPLGSTRPRTASPEGPRGRTAYLGGELEVNFRLVREALLHLGPRFSQGAATQRGLSDPDPARPRCPRIGDLGPSWAAGTAGLDVEPARDGTWMGQKTPVEQRALAWGPGEAGKHPELRESGGDERGRWGTAAGRDLTPACYCPPCAPPVPIPGSLTGGAKACWSVKGEQPRSQGEADLKQKVPHSPACGQASSGLTSKGGRDGPLCRGTAHGRPHSREGSPSPSSRGVAPAGPDSGL